MIARNLAEEENVPDLAPPPERAAEQARAEQAEEKQDGSAPRTA